MASQDVTMMEPHDAIQENCKKKFRKRRAAAKCDNEEWQCKHWGKRIYIDAYRPEVMEVIINTRLNKETAVKKTNILTYLMETMRTGIHNHDWLLVSKCVEGLSEEYKKIRRTFWILWNGGFLALANVYKDDITKIVDFARFARPMIKCYPRRLGIEVATWMTQKGYFSWGVELMDELYTTTPGISSYDKEVELKNPKRYQVDLVHSVIKAAHAYACWKRDVNLLKQGLYPGDKIAVRRVGEKALEQFELVLECAEKADADVTIFIKPLIELTMEFKTEFVARALFLRLVEKYDRNFILEALYLKLIETYFPFLEEEVEYFQQCRKRYRFIKKDKQLPLFKFRNWRDGLLKGGADVPLRPQQLPSFSP